MAKKAYTPWKVIERKGDYTIEYDQHNDLYYVSDSGSPFERHTTLKRAQNRFKSVLKSANISGRTKKPQKRIGSIKRTGIITALAILGVGAAIYFGYQYISNRLIWGNATLKFSNTSLTSTIATISWPLQNKTAITYLFESFTGKLTYNGGKLADVVMNEPLTIPAGATTTMSIDVPISFIGAGALILSAITQGQWTAPIMLEGMATVNSVPVPVNMDMNILPI